MTTKILFTSDTHYGHTNILKYCGRPWQDVNEMNEALIRRWNERTSPDDTVYHLGDFAMGSKENLSIRKRLNGRIVLIRGNHDRSPSTMLEAGFDEVHDYLYIEIEGTKLYLAHIPLHISNPTNRRYNPKLVQNPIEKYDYFLCGHVHQRWGRIGNTINVGVDVSDYYPLTLQELLNRDNNK